NDYFKRSGTGVGRIIGSKQLACLTDTYRVTGPGCCSGLGIRAQLKIGGNTVMSSPLSPFHTGKVRDIYEAGDDLLMVTSDRISAFDVVMKELIPGKGKVLTGLTAFWLRGPLARVAPN